MFVTLKKARKIEGKMGFDSILFLLSIIIRTIGVQIILHPEININQVHPLTIIQSNYRLANLRPDQLTQSMLSVQASSSWLEIRRAVEDVDETWTL